MKNRNLFIFFEVYVFRLFPEKKKIEKIGKKALYSNRTDTQAILIFLLPQAAATTCYVATNPRLSHVTGKYFADCNESSPSKLAASPAEAARLWSASEIMVNANSKLVFDPNNALD